MSLNANAVAGYKRAMAARGETVTFIRVNADAPNVGIVKAVVQAIVMTYSAASPIGGFAGPDDAISEGDRKIIVLLDDLRDRRFPLPVLKNDRVLVQGIEMNVESVDPSTRGTAAALDIVVKGV